MKSVCISLAVAWLFILSGTAQKTFDDKKRSETADTSALILKGLTLPQIATRPNVKAATKPVDFQMKTDIMQPFQEKKYNHKKIVKAKNGIPIYIHSESTGNVNLKSAKSAKDLSFEYLKEVAPMLKVSAPDNEFEVKTVEKDNLGQTHIKMQQVYQGIKIFGSEINVHVNNKNQVHLLNGRNVPTPKLSSVEPALTKTRAYDEALKDLKQNSRVVDYEFEGQHSFLNHKAPEPELLIYNADNNIDKLVWHVTVFPNVIERWEYFIDAGDGSVVDKYNHTCSFVPNVDANAVDLNGVTRTIGTHLVDGTYFLMNTSKPMFNAGESQLPDKVVGGIITFDLQNKHLAEESDIYYLTSADNNWNNPTAVSAHYNADVSYEYFRQVFGRNSIDGQGGSIYSIINVAEDENGTGLDNAFWNGKAMFYGNGNLGFTPLAGGLDVGGHEMSHGVIESSAGLVYKDQSGAINESFADVFGVMIDRDDYLLAEDVVLPNYFPSGAMRNMQDPHNGGSTLGDPGWQPSHVSEFYSGTQDNGGVHINSGIPNRAFYQFATNVGKEKAEQVYYRALTVYLTASSEFADLRLAVVQAAADIHGEGSAEVQAANAAFDLVGIYAEEGGGNQNPGGGDDNSVPVATGEDYMLLYNLSTTDPNKIYIYDMANDNFIPISQTNLARKPSVSDDGSLALCVTETNALNYIELNGANSVEGVLNAESVWGNVSISKDGTKLAAVGTQNNNTIVVLDLVSEQSIIYTLYNPTTVEGVTTGNVQYADALEWDYTGQYVMYDALNTLQNADGYDVEYWDIGFIKVWDNATNSFGDGSIQKLFANLPEGISIGNPSFSKTSRDIVAFDMYNANLDEYTVLSGNIETGDLQTVWNNTKLGFPNYSKTDEQLIFDAEDTDGYGVIATINMSSDKITPSGEPSVYIWEAQWATWYAAGQRQILNSGKDITDFRFRDTYPVSVATISNNQISVTVPNNTDVSNLIASFSLSSKATAKINGNTQLSGITRNNFTNPVMYQIVAEDGTSQNYTVNVNVTNTTDVEISKQNKFNTYPNPFSNSIRLVYDDIKPDAEVVIMNMLGQVVYQKNVDSAVTTATGIEINLPEILPGAYILQLINGDEILSKRIIKN